MENELMKEGLFHPQQRGKQVVIQQDLKKQKYMPM